MEDLKQLFACDIYVAILGDDHNRSRLQGMVCEECGEDVEETWECGTRVIADDLYPSTIYCEECWRHWDWANNEVGHVPLFEPAVLNDCYECGKVSPLRYVAVCEDHEYRCHLCWLDWLQDEGSADDEDEEEWSSDDEDGPWCLFCDIEIGPKSYYVTDPGGSTFCMKCWDEWFEKDEPKKKEARGDNGAARGNDATGRARNDRDKAKLRARYKDHCAYHLFHAHHRKHQGCTFAAAGQDRCSRGSHRVPDDFEDAQAELETPARA